MSLLHATDALTVDSFDRDRLAGLKAYEYEEYSSRRQRLPVDGGQSVVLILIYRMIGPQAVNGVLTELISQMACN